MPSDRSVTPSAGLLAGWRVLDASVWRPGPYATQLLAEIGADVLKIEPPSGDPMRGYPDLFASLNANKRSVALDLKRADDRQRAIELAAGADVVVEGFRPGVADRLGIGYGEVAAVNPAVIYCSISGMGQSGPLAHVSGHDLNFQAWAGVLSPDGGPPVVPAIPIADLAAGMTAAFAVSAAAVRRQATGEGERIDVAMGDVLATWTGAAAPQAAGDGPGRREVPGYGTFWTADGLHVALGVVNEDHLWRPLCDALDLAAYRDLTFEDRLAGGSGLQERVASAIRRWDRDELVAFLLAVDVPVAPVLDRAGMLSTEHFRARGIATADPWRDPTTGYPVSFTRHPAARTSPPPDLDEHGGAGWLPQPRS